MNKTKRNARGITLIALVITIIVLLILAGVTIAALSGDNGILTKAKEAKEKTEQAQKDEERSLQEITDTMNGVEGYNRNKKANSPKVITGMIPIKWKNNNWIVCSQDDAEWYNYDDKKEWANVMLSDGTYKSGTVTEGQVVQENELGSMYVWIPRYAYKIAGEKNIEVTFLKGNTNEGVDGATYTTDQTTDTTKTAIVHPAFNLGGTELNGFWVAKFEASGTNKDGNAVGNASSSAAGEQYAPDSTTIAKSLPNKISWGYISIGESEKRSMDIATTDKEKFGLTSGTNSHLIKNSEWGAVAYLSYSKYGNIPMTNGTGSLVTGSHWYDIYTGQGPKSETDETYYSYDESHNYNTSNGILASTTKNVTGVYDMAGGAWEGVAGYLDNSNANLSAFGKSEDGSIQYFENGKLNSKYTNLWDSYEVSEEEKNNKVTLSDGTVETGLWDGSKTALKYQEARYRLTKYNYDHMANHKGIGVNEVIKTTSKPFSFQAPSGTNNSWRWFTSAEDAVAGKEDYGRTWNKDDVIIGHLATCFILRSGQCGEGASAGILYSYMTDGRKIHSVGFRSTLTV